VTIRNYAGSSRRGSRLKVIRWKYIPRRHCNPDAHLFCQRLLPAIAKAPFDAAAARQQQEAWARHLGTLVETTNSVSEDPHSAG
jgi:hypothetical protein